MSGQGTFNAQTGWCECLGLPHEDQVCNQACRTNQLRLEVRTTEGESYIDAVDPVNGILTSSLLSDNQNILGDPSCPSGSSCEMFIIAMSPSAMTGIYDPSFDLLQSILGQESSSSSRRKSDVLLTMSAAERREDNSTEITYTGIANPVVCVEFNEALVFRLVDNEHYPVYVKDSLYNNNDDFDFGGFRALEESMLSGQDVSSFSFTFSQKGTYVFADAGDQQRQMIVGAMGENEACRGSARILPATKSNLVAIAASAEQDLLLEPDWTLVAALISAVFVLATGVILGLRQFRHRTWGGGISPTPFYRTTAAGYSMSTHASRGGMVEKKALAQTFVSTTLDGEQTNVVGNATALVVPKSKQAEAGAPPGPVVDALFWDDSRQIDMEGFTVNTLYQLLESQTKQMGRELLKAKDEAKSFYDRIAVHTDELKGLVAHKLEASVGEAVFTGEMPVKERNRRKALAEDFLGTANAWAVTRHSNLIARLEHYDRMSVLIWRADVALEQTVNALRLADPASCPAEEELDLSEVQAAHASLMEAVTLADQEMTNEIYRRRLWPGTDDTLGAPMVDPVTNEAYNARSLHDASGRLRLIPGVTKLDVVTGLVVPDRKARVLKPNGRPAAPPESCCVHPTTGRVIPMVGSVALEPSSGRTVVTSCLMQEPGVSADQLVPWLPLPEDVETGLAAHNTRVVPGGKMTDPRSGRTCPVIAAGFDPRSRRAVPIGGVYTNPLTGKEAAITIGEAVLDSLSGRVVPIAGVSIDMSSGNVIPVGGLVKRSDGTKGKVAILPGTIGVDPLSGKEVMVDGGALSQSTGKAMAIYGGPASLSDSVEAGHESAWVATHSEIASMLMEVVEGHLTAHQNFASVMTAGKSADGMVEARAQMEHHRATSDLQTRLDSTMAQATNVMAAAKECFINMRRFNLRESAMERGRERARISLASSVKKDGVAIAAGAPEDDSGLSVLEAEINAREGFVRRQVTVYRYLKDAEKAVTEAFQTVLHEGLPADGEQSPVDEALNRLFTQIESMEAAVAREMARREDMSLDFHTVGRDVGPVLNMADEGVTVTEQALFSSHKTFHNTYSQSVRRLADIIDDSDRRASDNEEEAAAAAREAHTRELILDLMDELQGNLLKVEQDVVHREASLEMWRDMAGFYAEAAKALLNEQTQEAAQMASATGNRKLRHVETDTRHLLPATTLRPQDHQAFGSAVNIANVPPELANLLAALAEAASAAGSTQTPAMPSAKQPATITTVPVVPITATVSKELSSDEKSAVDRRLAEEEKDELEAIQTKMQRKKEQRLAEMRTRLDNALHDQSVSIERQNAALEKHEAEIEALEVELARERAKSEKVVKASLEAKRPELERLRVAQRSVSGDGNEESRVAAEVSRREARIEAAYRESMAEKEAMAIQNADKKAEEALRAATKRLEELVTMSETAADRALAEESHKNELQARAKITAAERYRAVSAARDSAFIEEARERGETLARNEGEGSDIQCRHQIARAEVIAAAAVEEAEAIEAARLGHVTKRTRAIETARFDIKAKMEAEGKEVSPAVVSLATMAAVAETDLELEKREEEIRAKVFAKRDRRLDNLRQDQATELQVASGAPEAPASILKGYSVKEAKAMAQAEGELDAQDQSDRQVLKEASGDADVLAEAELLESRLSARRRRRLISLHLDFVRKRQTALQRFINQHKTDQRKPTQPSQPGDLAESGKGVSMAACTASLHSTKPVTQLTTVEAVEEVVVQEMAAIQKEKDKEAMAQKAKEESKIASMARKEEASHNRKAELDQLKASFLTKLLSCKSDAERMEVISENQQQTVALEAKWSQIKSEQDSKEKAVVQPKESLSARHERERNELIAQLDQEDKEEMDALEEEIKQAQPDDPMADPHAASARKAAQQQRLENKRTRRLEALNRQQSNERAATGGELIEEEEEEESDVIIDDDDEEETIEEIRLKERQKKVLGDMDSRYAEEESHMAQIYKEEDERRRAREELEEMERVTRRRREHEAQMAKIKQEKPQISESELMKHMNQHEQEMLALESKMLEDYNRQSDIMRNKLEARRKRRLEEKARHREAEKRKELMLQQKEREEMKNKLSKQKDDEAIQEAVTALSGDQAAQAVELILQRRHRKELAALSSKHVVQQDVVEADTRSELEKKHVTIRTELQLKHSTELATELQNLSGDALEAKQAELLSKQKKELDDLEQAQTLEADQEVNLRRSDLVNAQQEELLQTRQRQYQEFAASVEEHDLESELLEKHASEMKQAVESLERFQDQLEDDTRIKLEKLKLEKQRLNNESNKKLQEELDRMDAEIKAEENRERLSSEANESAVISQQAALREARRKRQEEELMSKLGQGFSDEDKGLLLESFSKDLERLEEAMDSDRLRQKNTFQKRLKKKRDDQRRRKRAALQAQAALKLAEEEKRLEQQRSEEAAAAAIKLQEQQQLDLKKRDEERAAESLSRAEKEAQRIREEEEKLQRETEAIHEERQQLMKKSLKLQSGGGGGKTNEEWMELLKESPLFGRLEALEGRLTSAITVSTLTPKIKEALEAIQTASAQAPSSKAAASSDDTGRPLELHFGSNS